MNSSDFYAVNAAGEGSSRIYCSTQINRSSNIYYSSFLDSCSFCLGCVGLKNKSYCLLNKQYSKEEWTALAARIFASMEADGTLGRFFPASMNPYYFNDTLAAMVFDDFDRDEITAEGFLWRDAPVRADIPEGAEVVETADLGRYQGYSPSGEWRIDPAVMRLVIRDERGNIYRIVPMEYEFLARYALPLPDTHWLDRIKTGFRI